MSLPSPERLHPPAPDEPSPAPTTTGARWPWVAWVVLTFGLWNSCASHAGARWSDGLLARGDYPRTLAFALAALRGAGTDDSDISRYLAYSNATLGRPYQSFYVRPFEGWTGPQPDSATGSDPDDPAQTPPRHPDRPLLPYRDFSVEYPPGFFLLALPPALLGLELDGYRLVFSLLMALLLTAALLAAIRIGRVLRPQTEPSPVAVATLLALALGTVAVRRFDAVVSLSLCLFLDGCLRRRPVLSGLALGVGLVTKVVPVLVLPVAVVYWGALRRWRELSVTALVSGLVAVAVGVPFLLTGEHLLDLVQYHGQRPLEVESTGAALLTIGRFFDPASAWRVATYGSDNVVGPADRFLLPLAGVLPLLAAAAILAWSVVQTREALRGPDGERISGEVLVRAACATLAASMALGKVFSAQYLAWLLPVGVLVSVLDTGSRRRTAVLLLGGAMLLTQLNQHFFFGLLGQGPHPLMGVLFLLRNALVMAWAVWILVPGPRARSSTVSDERAPSGSPPLSGAARL